MFRQAHAVCFGREPQQKVRIAMDTNASAVDFAFLLLRMCYQSSQTVCIGWLILRFSGSSLVHFISACKLQRTFRWNSWVSRFPSQLQTPLDGELCSCGSQPCHPHHFLGKVWCRDGRHVEWRGLGILTGEMRRTAAPSHGEGTLDLECFIVNSVGT